MTSIITPHSHSPIYTPTEVIMVDSRVIACDGGGGALGHPKVYQRIIGTELLCPYCSRLYVLSDDAAGHDTGH